MKRPVVTLLLLLAPVVAGAQTPTDTMLPIVVTATRTPVPATTLANGVTVLQGDDLRRAGVTSVVEALRGVPSVAFAQAGSYGAQTSQFLRGGESDYVRVLLDGVPLNQAGGAIDMANLTTENIDRIEVVRGPASVLYGSDAVTGVIQIFSRRAAGATRVVAEAAGGSRGSSIEAVEVSAGGRIAGVSAGVQHEATRGINDLNNRHDNTAASARVSLTPDARTDLQLTAKWRSGAFHYPTDGSGAATDSNQFQRSRQATVSLDAGRRLGARSEIRALLGLAVARDSTDNRPDSPGDTDSSESRRDMIRQGADLRANLRVSDPVLLTIGAAVEREHVKNRSSFGAFGSPENDLTRTNAAAYVQALGQGGVLSVQSGLRVDNNQRFGVHVTWRAGASLRLSRATRLRASAGTAFKEPTFDENYSTAFSTGNPDLRPERSVSVEAGLERSLASGRGAASVTAFTQRFRDLIQYTYSPVPTDVNFFNVASAVASGIEAELRGDVSPAVSLSAQYTWLHTSAADSGFDGAVFAKGQRLLRRPTHAGSLSGEWHATMAAAGARLLYVGSRTDLDFSQFPATRVTLEAYGRLDVWGRVIVARARNGRSSLALSVRVDNVTNATYEEIWGFGAPGRRILVGGRIEVR